MKKNRLLTLLMVLALITTMLAGCGAASENSAPQEAPDAGWAADGIYESASDMVVEESMSTGSTGSAGIQNQKLIRTMEMEVETNDLDTLLAQLTGKISALNGYVENKSVRNGSSSAVRRYRYADLTIRIPVDQLDAFVEHVHGQTNVVSYYENADDITLSYVATQSRITALETEQTRLLELLAQAENMTDLLQIEQRLTDVRTELEEVTSQLRLYDNLVDYGTVNLSISEVQEYTPVEEETVWQQIAGGLKENWQALCNGATDVFIFLVTSLPYLIPIGLAAGVTVLAVKLATRKKPAAKKEQPPETESE